MKIFNRSSTCNCEGVSGVVFQQQRWIQRKANRLNKVVEFHPPGQTQQSDVKVLSLRFFVVFRVNHSFDYSVVDERRSAEIFVIPTAIICSCRVPFTDTNICHFQSGFDLQDAMSGWNIRILVSWIEKGFEYTCQDIFFVDEASAAVKTSWIMNA